MSILARAVFAPAPPERLATLRLLIGGYALVYLLIRSVHLMSYADADPVLFTPVGVVNVLPRPLLPSVVRGLVVATVGLSIPFFLGYRYRWTAPLFALHCSGRSRTAIRSGRFSIPITCSCSR